MKKFNFAKIVSLICVCAMLLGALTIATFAADETDEVVIASNNVYYGEKFQIMYAISKGVDDITAVDSQGNSVEVVSFTDPDTGASTVTLNGVEYDMYITKDGVAAQAIDEVITVTVKANGETAKQSYSVLQYTYERTQALNAKEQTDDDDVVKELAMLNTLVSYADATNAFLNNATGSFTDYKYVTVIGGTLDGDNKSGMFLPGATPFANIVGTINVGEGQSIGWTVSVDGAEATEISLADLHTLTITGNTTVIATAIDSECDHDWTDATCTTAAKCNLCGATGELAEHDWDDATCLLAKTCSVCGATDGEALGHTAPNASGNCDRCGVSLLKTVTLKYSGSTSNMTGSNDAAKVGLDASLFSVIGNKGGTSNNCGLNTAGQIRLYANKTDGNGSYFTVTIAEGYTIKSIKISVGGTNGGFKVTAGDTVLAETVTVKNTTVSYDVNGSGFKLQNVVTGTTTQVYILNIEITYAAD